MDQQPEIQYILSPIEIVSSPQEEILPSHCPHGHEITPCAPALSSTHLRHHAQRLAQTCMDCSHTLLMEEIFHLRLGYCFAIRKLEVPIGAHGCQTLGEYFDLHEEDWTDEMSENLDKILGLHGEWTLELRCKEWEWAAKWPSCSPGLMPDGKTVFEHELQSAKFYKGLQVVSIAHLDGPLSCLI